MHKINKAHQVRLMTLESSWRMVGLISCGGLALLILFMVMPVVTNRSSALDQAHWTEYGAVPSAIALSLDTKELETTITPTAGGVTAESTARLSINTQNAGFELYLSTLDSTTSMSSTNSDYEIKSITNPTASLSPNTWGYRMNDDTMYQPISLEPTLTTTLPAEFGSESTSLALHFGHNVDTALPAGQYTNTVVLSAIASSAKVQGLLGLNYMQDMTTNICNNTIGTDFSTEKDIHDSFIIKPGQEPTKQLIDLRDNKDYWVAKLADGNCWMTQNLALDLNEKTLPLKPETSDVSGEWRPGSYTENSVPNVATPTFTSTRSWNLGKVVLATPTRGVNCVAVPTSDFPDNDSGDSLRPNQKLGEVCSDFVDVSGENWYPTFEADKDGFRVNNGYGDGIWLSTNYDSATGNVVYSTYDTADDTASPDGGVVTVERKAEGGKYDAHYLIGNYYQWGTAVAGTNYIDGRPVVSGSRADPDKLVNTKDSICPKGWKLPVAGGNTKTGQPFVRQDSFVSLFAAYGYPTDNYTPSSISGYTPFLNGENQNPELAPFYYPRSGVVFASYGVMIYTGMIGSASSSTIAPGAYKFAFTMQIGSLSNADVLHTSGDSSRFMAKNVRCMAR